MAPDLLSTIRHEIDGRLSELRPLLAEYERLLGAVEALEVADGEIGPAVATEPTPPAKRSRSGARPGSALRGSGSGTRELALAESAKITVGEQAVEQEAVEQEAVEQEGVEQEGAEQEGDEERAVEQPAAKGSVEGQVKKLDIDAQLDPRSSRSTAQPKPERSARAIRELILAALEHGSHTVGELAVVTAMSGPNINGNLHKLVSEGVVVKTEREGKAAWALPEAIE